MRHSRITDSAGLFLFTQMPVSARQCSLFTEDPDEWMNWNWKVLYLPQSRVQNRGKKAVETQLDKLAVAFSLVLAYMPLDSDRHRYIYKKGLRL